MNAAANIERKLPTRNNESRAWPHIFAPDSSSLAYFQTDYPYLSEIIARETEGFQPPLLLFSISFTIISAWVSL